MKFSFDDVEISIACPGCGKEIKKNIGWFKEDGNHCPGCGLGFATKEFRRGIEQCEKDVDKLRAEFKKAFR